MGVLLLNQGRPAEARVHLEAALKAYLAILPAEHTYLSDLRRQLGQVEEAEKNSRWVGGMGQAPGVEGVKDSFSELTRV